MPRTAYTPQEADIWNYTFSAVWLRHIWEHGPDEDDEAAAGAVELASRAVEAFRRKQQEG